MKRARTGMAVLSAILALAAARPAAAEEVLLSSGTRYDATEISLVGDAQVRFTFRVGGGTATVAMPWEKLDPWSAFSIRATRTKADDARGQLSLAKFAMERGLYKEAARRYEKAAALDPTLSAERDAGLVAVRDAQLVAALDAAMLDVKRGRGDLALAKAKDVLAKATPGSLPAQRATSLVELSESVAARDAARRQAEERERAETAAKAIAETLNAVIARSDKFVRSAIEQRDKAADPNLRAANAIGFLEQAETALREARRSLKSGFEAVGDRRPELEARDDEAFALLVATHVDLADLYRQERRFDRARDRLRAATLLDPDDVRAREVRDLVEQDLRTPPPRDPYDDPYVPSFSTTWYGGPYLSSPVVVGRPSCWGCGPRIVGGYRSGGWSFRYRW
jgi:tetratricopeptide (TPR) repeat protein